MRARDDDRGLLERLADLDDVGLDALVVVVALGGGLLGRRQQRLDALRAADERVAAVRLLHDAGDDVAHAVDVLLEDLLALGLADDLQDDLLGRLRGDARDVGRRDVLLLDDRAFEVLGLVADELVDVDAAVVAVDRDPDLVLEVEHLLVGGSEGLLEAVEDDELVDALLALELPSAPLSVQSSSLARSLPL